MWNNFTIRERFQISKTDQEITAAISESTLLVELSKHQNIPSMEKLKHSNHWISTWWACITNATDLGEELLCMPPNLHCCLCANMFCN